MHDHLTDQAVRSAFAELQATEQPGLVPPGVGAAHRTVRRRRVAASATASLAAVLLLAAVYLAGSLSGAGRPGPDLGIDPAPDPAASEGSGSPADDPLAELDDPELAQIALDAVGEQPPGTFVVVGGNAGQVASAAVGQVPTCCGPAAAGTAAWWSPARWATMSTW